MAQAQVICCLLIFIYLHDAFEQSESAFMCMQFHVSPSMCGVVAV